MRGATYPEILLTGKPLAVERITEVAPALDLAPAIVDLVAKTYSAQFEQPVGPLPPGLMARRYNKEEPAQIDAMRSRILTSLVRGGEYHVIHHPTNTQALIGLIRTIPRPDKSCHIGDILVDPGTSATPYGQRKGYGSALLYTALQQYDPNLPADLEGYDDSLVNNWYQAMGFSKGEPADSWFIEGYELPMSAYYAPAIGGIMRYLVQHKPFLSYCRTIHDDVPKQ